MASRMAEATALARRCERAGLRVVQVNKGFKVYGHDGKMVPIHLTPSDVRALANNEKQLERIGLKEAEANMAQVRFSEKEAADKKANDSIARKTTAARKSAQTAALTRVTGGYLTEPEDVGIMWFAERHPAPWMRWVYITPEIASYLLKNHNSDNRPLNGKQVEHYRRIILSGQWHLTHQGIAMDTNAVLQDGQHRLEAVVSAGMTSGDDDLKVPFAFYVGMPPENFKAIDEGLLRTAAQLFSKGGEKNGTTLQTTIRMVIAYKDPDLRGGIRLKVPNGRIIDQFSEDPERFRECAGHAQTHYRKYRTSPGAVAAAQYLLRGANGDDNRYVHAFFEGLRTGLKTGTRMVLDDDDPRNVYRESMQRSKEGLLKKKFTSTDQLALMITAWNNLVSGLRPRYMKYGDGEIPMPRIMVCADSGPRASACPSQLIGEVDGDDEDDD